MHTNGATNGCIYGSETKFPFVRTYDIGGDSFDDNWKELLL